MVCPMAKKTQQRAEVSTEYPYQPLYRPVSWIFSSFFNIILLAFLVGLAYYLYRTRKNRKARNCVTYRTVQMQNAPSSEGKKVALVTGGNGYLGTELVKSLVADGEYTVHSLDILLPEYDARNGAVSTYIQADITSPDDLCIAFKDVDVVFHCAGLTPMSLRHTSEDYRRVNVEGTENVIQACAKCRVKRLIYTSTVSVNVSRNPKLTHVDCDESSPMPSDPLNAYTASKGQADKLVREANGKDGLLTCVIRPGGFTQNMVKAISKIPVYPKMDMFDFSVASVESVVKAHVLAEKKLSVTSDGGQPPVVAGKVYNISDGKLSVPELAQFIASEKNTSLVTVPYSLVRFLAGVNSLVYTLTGFVLMGDSFSLISVDYKTHTYVTGLARKELGWVPGAPWQEVVREMVKTQDGSKKDN